MARINKKEVRKRPRRHAILYFSAPSRQLFSEWTTPPIERINGHPVSLENTKIQKHRRPRYNHPAQAGGAGYWRHSWSYFSLFCQGWKNRELEEIQMPGYLRGTANTNTNTNPLHLVYEFSWCREQVHLIPANYSICFAAPSFFCLALPCLALFRCPKDSVA